MGRAGRRGRGGPNPVDIHVGSRVRLQRTLLGMSQKRLGQAIDLSIQQVQKYESGSNRISAGRLYDLSRVLDVPIGYFFDDMPEGTAARSPRQARGAVEVPLDTIAKRETLKLVRAYNKIHDLRTRKIIFEVIKALATSY